MQAQRDTLLEKLGQTLQEQIWHGHRHFMSLGEKTGLTVPQIVVLEKLKESGRPCSMQELSELTLQSGAALTGVIDRLVKAGFVVRVPHAHDRRVVAVTLTEAGDERLQDLQHYLRTSFARDMQAFSNEELQQFIFLLQKFIAVSDEPIGKAGYPGSCHHPEQDETAFQTLTGNNGSSDTLVSE